MDFYASLESNKYNMANRVRPHLDLFQDTKGQQNAVNVVYSFVSQVSVSLKLQLEYD